MYSIRLNTRLRAWMCICRGFQSYCQILASGPKQKTKLAGSTNTYGNNWLLRIFLSLYDARDQRWKMQMQAKKSNNKTHFLEVKIICSQKTQFVDREDKKNMEKRRKNFKYCVHCSNPYKENRVD